MSSSLNDLLMMRIVNLIRQLPSSFGDINGKIRELTDWNSSLIDQVSELMIDNATTERGIQDLYDWGRFLFWEMRKMNPEIEKERFYGMIHVIDLMFKFLGRPTKIPFKYWSDIAPQLVNEVRRYRAQSESFDHFYKHEMNAKPLDEKEHWLATNSETAEIYERWNGENMFSN